MGCIFEGPQEVKYRPSLTDEQMAIQKALAEWFGTRYGNMATPWEGPVTAPIPSGYEDASNIYRQMAGLGPSAYMEQPMTGYHTTFPGWDIDKPVREAWGITDEPNGPEPNGPKPKPEPNGPKPRKESLVSEEALQRYYAQRGPWTA